MPEPCRPRYRTAALLGLALLVCAPQALAQFKWTKPDGRITYGDRPPPGATPVGAGTASAAADVGPRAASAAAAGGEAPDASERIAQGARTARAASSGAELPYALRVLAGRQPVTLYTTPDCAPCAQAGELLRERGIPHEARTVATNEDVAAFRGLGFSELSFPVLQVGTDRVAGFEANRWKQALDAAGYPPDSKLPPRWRFSSARPLAQRKGPAPVVVASEASNVGDVRGAHVADPTPRDPASRRDEGRANARASGAAAAIRF